MHDPVAPEPAAQPAQPPAAQAAAAGTSPHREYAGEGIVVHWNAERCIHTGRCIAAQPGVFDPKRRPWVDVTQADTDAIADAVARCPTGALSYTRTDGAPGEAVPELVTIRVASAGPLEVRGHVRVASEGTNDAAPRTLDAARTEVGRVTLCRCGRTQHAPYCDNSHRALGAGWAQRDGFPPQLPPQPLV